MSQTKRKTNQGSSGNSGNTSHTQRPAQQSEMLRAYLASGPTTATERLAALDDDGGDGNGNLSIAETLARKAARLDELARLAAPVRG